MIEAGHDHDFDATWIHYEREHCLQRVGGSPSHHSTMICESTNNSLENNASELAFVLVFVFC